MVSIAISSISAASRTLPVMSLRNRSSLYMSMWGQNVTLVEGRDSDEGPGPFRSPQGSRWPMEGFTQLARTCIASSGVDHDIATVESRRRVGSVAAAHLVVVDDVARPLVPDLDAEPIRPVRKSPGRSPAAPRGRIRWRFRTSRPAHQRI